MRQAVKENTGKWFEDMSQKDQKKLKKMVEGEADTVMSEANTATQDDDEEEKTVDSGDFAVQSKAAQAFRSRFKRVDKSHEDEIHDNLEARKDAIKKAFGRKL
jgi:hypothetical protein